MKPKHIRGFTLVELVVVITILAILGTLAFMSISGYSRNARNSVRVNDMRLIEKGFQLYIQTNSIYPLPDNPIEINYSGSLAWTQGIFSTGVISEVRRVSEIPLDPQFQVPYTYSVLENRSKYQISGIIEGGLFSLAPLENTYAIESAGFSSYTLGNFQAYDIRIPFASGCYMIPTPSIILSDIPNDRNLQNGTYYHFSYQKSPHIPQSFSGVLSAGPLTSGFQIIELYNSCSIDTIDDLDLYIARLSTAYQSFAANPLYEDLIYNSHFLDVKKSLLIHLESNLIKIDKSVKDIIDSPLPQRTFADNFSGTDGDTLLSRQADSSTGTWLFLGGANTSSYNIISNTLQKIDSNTSLLIPNHIPPATNDDYTMEFNIGSFAGGSIDVYLRYLDSNNYYKLSITGNGYQITRRVGGVNTILQDINEVISPGARTVFGMKDDTLVLSIDSVEKENIVASGVNGIGKNIISIQNTGGNIDNFVFKYY